MVDSITDYESRAEYIEATGFKLPFRIIILKSMFRGRELLMMVNAERPDLQKQTPTNYKTELMHTICN
jgi:hypothetical protein